METRNFNQDVILETTTTKASATKAQPEQPKMSLFGMKQASPVDQSPVMSFTALKLQGSFKKDPTLTADNNG